MPIMAFRTLIKVINPKVCVSEKPLQLFYNVYKETVTSVNDQSTDYVDYVYFHFDCYLIVSSISLFTIVRSKK